MKKGCFAFISKYKCNALVTIDCQGCRFYKTKKQYEEELKNAEIRNNKKQSR